MILLGIFSLILTLLFVIGIHETGHALAAKFFNIKIKRISFGFGKPLFKWRWRKSDIELIWSKWPFGGSVTLLNSRITPVSKEELPYCFDKKPIYVRFIVLVAGGLFNFFLAWVAFIGVLSLGYMNHPAVIQKVIPNSIADEAGIKAKERIIDISGKAIHSWNDAGMTLIMNLNHKITIRFSNFKKVKVDLTKLQLNKHSSSLLTQIGIIPSPLLSEKENGLSIWLATKQSFCKIIELLIFYLVMIKQLLLQKIPFTLLLGPIGLLVVATKSFIQGLSVFLYFVSTLSLAVGLVNLLPLPGLDGGSIFYLVLEKIRKKTLSVSMEILLYKLAFILFFIFFIQLILNDVQRYFIS